MIILYNEKCQTFSFLNAYLTQSLSSTLHSKQSLILCTKPLPKLHLFPSNMDLYSGLSTVGMSSSGTFKEPPQGNSERVPHFPLAKTANIPSLQWHTKAYKQEMLIVRPSKHLESEVSSSGNCHPCRASDGFICPQTERPEQKKTVPGSRDVGSLLVCMPLCSPIDFCTEDKAGEALFYQAMGSLSYSSVNCSITYAGRSNVISLLLAVRASDAENVRFWALSIFKITDVGEAVRESSCKKKKKKNWDRLFTLLIDA